MTPAERTLLLEVAQLLVALLPEDDTVQLRLALQAAGVETHTGPDCLAEALHSAGYHHLAGAAR